MPAQSQRPLLLLDVDGVLLPVLDQDRFGGYYAPASDFRRTALRHWGTGEAFEIWTTPANGDRLRRLRRSFDLVWATGWNEHANEIIAPLHDLPELPTIDLAWSEELRSLETSWKLAAVSEYVADRPCVWIDDHVRADVARWAESRSTPTLVLRADHRVGLTDDLTDRALDFAAQLRR